MPDFGPYLIFCLYLSRMQKYAFFSRLCKHSRGNPSPARLFLKKNFSARGACRLIRKWSDTTWTHGKNNFHNFYNNEQKSGN